MEFNSGLEVVKGESVGKLAPKVTGGRVGLGALLGNELRKVSDASVAAGAGVRAEGKVVDDKEVEVRLREPVLEGSKGGVTSGKDELSKLAGAAGKGALKLGYCIGCCMEGGIDSPGDGRSKDCWCRCGSPFGGP